MRFVHRLVRQPRISGEIADGEEMRQLDVADVWQANLDPAHCRIPLATATTLSASTPKWRRSAERVSLRPKPSVPSVT